MSDLIQGLVVIALGLLLLVIGLGMGAAWIWEMWSKEKRRTEHEPDWAAQVAKVTAQFEKEAAMSRMLRGQRVPIGLRKRGVPLVENKDGRAEIDRVTRRRMSDE